MKRIIGALCLSLAIIGLLPGAAAAAAGSKPTCDILVAPAMGSPSDSFRISGTGFPAGTLEQPTEVRLDVRRAGDRAMTTIFLTLVPGGTWFYYDYHADYGEGEPNPPLSPGRYLVGAETQNHGCRDRTAFIVTG